jgi:hypothetical protein
MSSRKLAIVLALATSVVLIAMVITGLTTGAAQEPHEHFMAPDVYAQSLLAHRGGLRLMMALDVAFLVLYTAFFIALARQLKSLFAWFGLGAMIVVAVLDIVEDHHIIAMLESAEHGIVPDVGSIAWQAAESATKFSISYLSLVLFGLAIPRTRTIGWVFTLYLTVGTLASAIVGYAVGPETQPSIESGRWIGFLAGFALAITWLWREPD